MANNLRIFAVFIICFIHYTKCAIFSGKCPDVNAMQGFNVDRYLGTWYEHSHYQYLGDDSKMCTKVIYKVMGSHTIAVEISTLDKRLGATIFKGTVRVLAPGELFIYKANKKIVNFQYKILGTDYKNWAVIYNCYNIPSGRHSKMVWILTRQRQPSAEAIAAAKQVIERYNFPTILFTKTIQNDCPNDIKIFRDTSKVAFGFFD